MIAGVNGTDPTRVMDRFLDHVEAMGFSGVINFPSIGYTDGRWRREPGSHRVRPVQGS